ncbi:MAG: hypothetical protein L0215_23050 [Gemmataceae bacterium]|nr:hypothetical protein [Gemmataceae bacterium]
MDDVRSTFERLIRTSSGVCTWIKDNKPRTDDTLIPFNFLACSVTYLEITRNTMPAPIQVVALCTRSVYELCLLARKVLPDPQERRRWLDETASDNVSVMEAWYELVGVSSPLAGTLRGQIEAFKRGITSKGGDFSQRPSRIADLAKEFGLEKEHKALFGLFSKLVHPSAFLINGWQHNKDQTLATTLILNLLDYADRLLQLVGSHVGTPEEIVRW